MRKIVLFLAFFCFFSGFAFAAGGEESESSASGAESYIDAAREDTLIIDNASRYDTQDNWNPMVPGNNAGGYSLYLSEPLAFLNYETGEYTFWLAESVEGSDDLMQYTINLREGTTWSDGTPYSVDDIIFTVDLQKATSTLSNYFTWNEWIESMEKIDDRTMVFNLTKPNPRFFYQYFSTFICGGFTTLPKHIWENVDDPISFKNFDLDAGLPMGTGPYSLARTTPNGSIWVRDDNWWGYTTGFSKLPAPKKIIYSYAGNEQVRVARAIDNGVDFLEDITYGAMDSLVKQNPEWEAWFDGLPFAWPDPCARTLTVNNAVEPWNDKDMRWMLSYVMDRQQIIDIAYEGTTSYGPYFWPKYAGLLKYNELIPDKYMDRLAKPNLEKAEEILLSKGYTRGSDNYWQKDGKQLVFEIQVHDAFIELERVADVYAEQLQRFGINGIKSKVIGSVWGDNSSTGEYTAQSGWQTCGSISEPFGTLNQLSAESIAPIGTRFGQTQEKQNRYRYMNPKYTAIVEELGTLALDDPKVMDLTEQALTILYEELPVIPTAQSKKIVPFNNTYWTNWPTAENNYAQPTMWCPIAMYILFQIEQVN